MRPKVRPRGSDGAVTLAPQLSFSQVEDLSGVAVIFATMNAPDPTTQPALPAALADLPAGILHLPGSPAYDSARHGWGVVTTPVAVLRPRSTAEVALAVKAAAASAVPLWVKSGGHSHHLGSGLLLDLAELTEVEVLPDDLVRLGTGSTWRAVMQQLAPHGLAITSGDTGCVGVGGIVTAGGIGWLVRTVGLTVDLVRRATVVLADGSIVTVDEEHRPDLLRALRGAGGNVGVVCEVEVQAHRVGRFAAGRITFDAGALRPALAAWRRVIRGAPETFNSSFTLGFDLGPPVPAVTFALAGSEADAVDEAAARALLEPVLSAAGVTGVELAVVDYPGLFGPDPEGYPPVQVVGSNGFAEFTDDLLEAIVEYHAGSRDDAPRWLLLRALGGAYARSSPADTVLGHRDAELVVLPSVMLPTRAGDDAIRQARSATRTVLDHTDGLHSNFTGETGADVVRRLFDEATLRELRMLKAEVDPDWLFRPVHTFPPAGRSGEGWSGEGWGGDR